MNILESFLCLMREINEHYAEAIQALTPFIIIIVSFFFSKQFREKHLKREDPANQVASVFWSLGKRYKILAVHRFEKSDSSASGYKSLGQNSRPDQWKQLISIQPSCFGLRYEVLPKKKSDILTVVISRNGKEKWKNIRLDPDA